MSVTHVGFTGHRNKQTTTACLDEVLQAYPGAVWIHGGAQGFDTQVAEYATAHGIRQLVLRPAYRIHPAKLAPLKRNVQIVDSSNVLVACYDGRWRGGTLYTISYAEKQGKPVMYVDCLPQVTTPQGADIKTE
jgi:hypothetical protein